MGIPENASGRFHLDSRDSSQVTHASARNPVERAIFGIWKSVFNRGDIGIGDDFYALGGNQNLEEQIASEIREVFRLHVSTMHLFESPTIASQAAVIEEMRSASKRPDAAIRPVSRSQNLPLSFLQQQLWFFDQLEPGSALYNTTIGVDISGALDVVTLTQSLNEIIRRHEALRTTFTEMGGEAFQTIAPELRITIPVLDLERLDPAERQSEILRQKEVEAKQPFDLARGPLIRARLIRLGANDHVFLLSMHHMVSDGWSFRILSNELGALYNTIQSGLPSPLSEFPIQYADFACWQRQRLQGDILDAELEYWKKKLHGLPPALTLPTDYPRPAISTYRGDVLNFILPVGLVQAIKDFSRQQGVTLYMTLLSAFQVLLYRYSGQEILCVGAPIVIRNRPELEGLIGLFINMLAIRADLSDSLTFSDFLHQVKETTLEAYAHQELPFELLVEKLQPERDGERTPFFQVMFVLENVRLQPLQMVGFNTNLYEIETGTSRFDLSFIIFEQASGVLACKIEYRADLFDPGTIERMSHHYQTLLQEAIANPLQRVSKIPILPDPERRLLVEQFNDTRVDFKNEHLLHELFEKQVDLSPEAAAVLFEGQQLTYRQLNARANQLAHHLKGLGVGPDVVVGICLERSLEMVIGMIGVLKAGGAYVPIEPTYPEERIKFVVRDTRAQVVLTLEDSRNRLPKEGVNIICLDTDWPDISRQPENNLSRSTTFDHLAQVIYTSGSTGQPKGVMIAHRSVCNFLAWLQLKMPLAESDCVLQQIPFSFDPSIWQIFAPLQAGARVILPKPGAQNDPAYLCKLICDMGITELAIVSSLLEMLLEEKGISACSSLMRVFCGGDVLSPELVDRFHAVLKADLFNSYGPTETTIAVTHWKCDPEWTHKRRNVPIGRPISNTQAYILDTHLNPVPVGIQGELYIGGECLARGYLNQAQLTDEKFIANPFAADSGTRLYKTGDLACYLPDGNIEFRGRVDNQVKLHGFRIELGEIEGVLRQHPGILACHAILREDIPGNKQIIAYFSPRPDLTIEPGELRNFLKTRLPEYMVPSAFVQLASFPYLPNGKINFKALPTPDQLQFGLEHISVFPRTPIEEILVDIWREILHLDNVGIEDNFFEIGGHSLLATQVISRIRAIFQIELPIRSLFESPTISELAGQVQASIQDQQVSQLPSILSVRRDQPIPLSFPQERIWFIHQLFPDSSAYHIAGAIRLKGPLNVAAIEYSFEKIVQRHEILRTVFETVDGQPVQRITDKPGFHLDRYHFPNLTIDECEKRTLDCIQEEIRKPFDLTTGPLLRVALFDFSETESILFMVTHHIISDAWSMGIMVRELEAFYNAQISDHQATLAELPIQYGDFAQWQRSWMQGAELEQQLTYWRQKLQGISVLELPTDRLRPEIQTFHGATQSMKISEQWLLRLRQLCQKYDVTLFMTFLAAFKVLLYRYTQQTDIAIGVPIANRQRIEIEGLIGTFVNTLVLRTDLSGDPIFSEVLRRVRSVALEAFAHQDLSFGKLVSELQPERDLSHSPLFQVMFNVVNIPSPVSRFTNLDTEILPIELKSAQFDLTCTIVNLNDLNEIRINYNTDLFNDDTIGRMMGHFFTLLEGVVSDPDQAISELPLLTEAEKHQLIVEWNDTFIQYPRASCVHTLFEEQARRSPQSTAVIGYSIKKDIETRISYAELDRASNQLANYLRKMNVKSNARVGISIDRSIEMVIGLLGILKAGGAYVPLDPAFPEERLRYMIEDAQVSAYVTQRSLSRQLPLPAELQDIVYLDQDWEKIIRESDCQPDRSSNGSDLAYILYTSGSTGKPKGVEISHHALTNLLCSMQHEPGIIDQDILLAITTLSFDIAGLELYLPLITGACVMVALQETAVDGSCLLNKLNSSGVTIMQATPATWLMLIAAGWKKTPGLKMLCGGETLSRELADQLLERGESLWNMYGPTETTIWSSTYEIKPGNDPINLGRPISNTQFYNLDSRLQLVPIGIPGELCIGGEGVARGYFNKPELTEGRFLPNPFLPKGRIYKTGDLVRLNARGDPEFLGRMDFQVKVRGYRIELGDIESALQTHSAIRQAVVIASEESPGNNRLIAFYIPEAAPAPKPEELRDYLRAKLPSYMAPSSFVSLEKFPLTPNGKVDRKALSNFQYGINVGQPEYTPPTTKVECELAEIWSSLLEVNRVGLQDDFFGLGGHSLLAVRLFAEIEKRYGIKLPLSTLFQASTLEALTQIIQNCGLPSLQISKYPVSLVPIQTKGSNPPFYCVHPIGGGVLGYYPLAHYMGEDQPFFGLEALPEDAADPSLDCIEGIAIKYVNAIQKIQPEGPYYLGGYSFGGTVAYEMAQYFQSHGHKIGLLAMLDHPAPNLGYFAPQFSRTFFIGFMRNLRVWSKDFWQISKGERIGRIRRKLHSPRLSRRKEEFDLSDYVDDVNLVPLEYRELTRRQFQAFSAYHPQPYDGHITLFRTPRQPLFCSYDPQLEWGKLAKGGVEMIQIAGTHRNVLAEPYVEVLASALKAAIGRSNIQD